MYKRKASPVKDYPNKRLRSETVKFINENLHVVKPIIASQHNDIFF